MKEIIDGILYDTDTAKLFYSYTFGLRVRSYGTKDIFITEDDRYFLHENSGEINFLLPLEEIDVYRFIREIAGEKEAKKYFPDMND